MECVNTLFAPRPAKSYRYDFNVTETALMYVYLSNPHFNLRRTITIRYNKANRSELTRFELYDLGVYLKTLVSTGVKAEFEKDLAE